MTRNQFFLLVIGVVVYTALLVLFIELEWWYAILGLLLVAVAIIFVPSIRLAVKQHKQVQEGKLPGIWRTRLPR
jgi:hypothetical protein